MRGPQHTRTSVGFCSALMSPNTWVGKLKVNCYLSNTPYTRHCGRRFSVNKVNKIWLLPSRCSQSMSVDVWTTPWITGTLDTVVERNQTDTENSMERGRWGSLPVRDGQRRLQKVCIKAGPREEEYNFEKQKRKNWERGYLGMKKQNQ